MTTLSAREAAILHAVAERLVPTDELGPGAREAGAVSYILSALAGPYRDQQRAYTEGLRALDAYATSSHGSAFCALAGEQQDALLRDVEEGTAPGFTPSSEAFFELVRTHVLEGMFGDPRWGGNADFAGWDLIGYPGIRRVWTESDQRLDAVVAPAHRGAADLGGAALEEEP